MQDQVIMEAIKGAEKLGLGQDMILIKHKVLQIAKDTKALIEAIKDESSEERDSEIELLNKDMFNKVRNLFEKKCEQGNINKDIS